MSINNNNNKRCTTDDDGNRDRQRERSLFWFRYLNISFSSFSLNIELLSSFKNDGFDFQTAKPLHLRSRFNNGWRAIWSPLCGLYGLFGQETNIFSVWITSMFEKIKKNHKIWTWNEEIFNEEYLFKTFLCLF